MIDNKQYAKWQKIVFAEHQSTTNVLENEYKQFIKKLNFDPRYVKTEKECVDENLSIMEIFLLNEGEWEPIGHIRMNENEELIRDGQSWFNVEGLEEKIEQYAMKLDEESAMAMGGIAGANQPLPSLDNEYGYWSTKKRKKEQDK